MKRTLTVGLASFVVLASLACGAADVSTPTPTPTPAPAKLSDEAKAAAIADAIAKDASQADKVLGEHGMTAEAYEALLFDIAKDPARTKSYLDARK